MRTPIFALALSLTALSAPAFATPLGGDSPAAPAQNASQTGSTPGVSTPTLSRRAGFGFGAGTGETFAASSTMLAPRAHRSGEPAPEPRPAWQSDGVRPRPGGYVDTSPGSAQPSTTPHHGAGKDGTHAIVSRNATINPVYRRARAAAADNVVRVASSEKFCMIMPRDAHTNVGDSEHPGGMQTYCSKQAKYSDQQGLIPDDFWKSVQYKTGYGEHGKRFAQLTGCIRPETVDRLNPSDYGGQYDSSGGADGNGNPQGSVCLGYKHYVELMEPAGPRACIRCCEDPADCPTHQDKEGCPKVIPGEYFDCN